MDYLVYKLLAPITAGFILLSIGISVRYLNAKISKLIFAYEISVLLFLVFNYLEFVTNNHSLIILYAQLEHVCIQLLAMAWFAFAIHYTGYDWIIKPRLIVIILILFVINNILIFTNSFHYLFWSSTSFVHKFELSELDATYGPVFWVVSAFDYTFLLAGVAFIIVSYIRGQSHLRRQAFTILIGFLIPFVTNFIYVFRVIPNVTKDFSSVAFAFTGLTIFISIYRFRLLQFSPLARNIVLHYLQDGVITLDINNTIIDYNNKSAILFNFDENSLGYKFNNTDVGKLLTLSEVTLENNRDKTINKEYRNKHYSIGIKAILNIKGTFLGTLIRFTDVSDKVKLISELKESNLKLQSMQQQLIQRDKMATLGQLSAGLAHEINNPLSFIKSNFGVVERYLNKISCLCNNEDDERAIALKEYLDELKDIMSDSVDGVNRINEVIQNLLGFSRDKKVQHRKLYDLNKGIESTLVIANSKLKYKAKVALELGAIPRIYSFGNEINQVLLNLITNAAQAIPEYSEDGKITIKTFLEEDKIICEVSDSGKPITDKEKERIFDPFFTSKVENGGTGLGLSISRNIIEGYEGALLLKDDNKTFRIELPVVDNN